jgi:tRNA A-37 threonylcarbamoyl transferase component Bud32
VKDPATDAPSQSEDSDRPQREPGPDRSDRGEAGVASADPRTTIAGRYAVDLESMPSESGIAVVYRGRDLRTREPVVVKTLRLEYRSDPQMRARFRREARLLQFLSHPNVIRALAFAEERGAPWLVLEQVQGNTLRQEITDHAPLSPEQVVPILRDAAAALDHLHARGLVHLDVRPENMVVTPDGHVKLIDFGFAQTSGSMQEAVDGTSEGSDYFAPEQLCGEPVTNATDVFALGCVAYECLSGQLPFVQTTMPGHANDAIRARLESAPRPPGAVRSDARLPAWVDDVVLEALARDPRERYGSASSFAMVFEAGVEGEVDVETGRPTRRASPARARKFPTNEPGIAVKGSPLLAARRGNAAVESEYDGARGAEIVDATYVSLPPAAAGDGKLGRSHGRSAHFELIRRRLWQAVIVAALLNVILIVALFFSRGEIPRIWSPAGIGPGTTVRVAGTGLVARAQPEPGATIVADLPEGGTIRVTGKSVDGTGGRWWPVEVQTTQGPVSGYVPESWVQSP